jgi:hypothetical protein
LDELAEDLFDFNDLADLNSLSYEKEAIDNRENRAIDRG